MYRFGLHDMHHAGGCSAKRPRSYCRVLLLNELSYKHVTCLLRKLKDETEFVRPLKGLGEGGSSRENGEPDHGALRSCASLGP